LNDCFVHRRRLRSFGSSDKPHEQSAGERNRIGDQKRIIDASPQSFFDSGIQGLKIFPGVNGGDFNAMPNRIFVNDLAWLAQPRLRVLWSTSVI
jgi:hypothetical protein